MDSTAPIVWWLVCGALVAAELLSGTLYLLMLALGCAAGAIGAHLGLGSTSQIAAAAVVGAGATSMMYLRRRRQPRASPAASNRDVNLDIGQHVKVEAWADDGSARIHYRGSTWSVRYTGAGAPAPGEHVIVALDGNELRVAPAAAH